MPTKFQELLEKTEDIEGLKRFIAALKEFNAEIDNNNAKLFKADEKFCYVTNVELGELLEKALDDNIQKLLNEKWEQL